MKKLEVTTETINTALKQVQAYADEKGLQIIGDITPLTEKPAFESWNKEKVLGRYLFRVDKKPSMSNINRFLHFLYRKTLHMDTKPRVEYSDKEIAIQAARKSWIEARDRAEVLLKAYKDQKGSFYKNKINQAV